jgi:hypothetical protein
MSFVVGFDDLALDEHAEVLGVNAQKPSCAY